MQHFRGRSTELFCVVRQISDKVLVARRLCRRNNLLNERKGVSSSPLICHRFLVFKRCITLNFNVFFPQQQHFFGGGANEVMTLSLRGGFIAEAISLRVEGIASVAIAPAQ
jgi:hypothetical protein